jgi:hypothetical protein
MIAAAISTGFAGIYNISPLTAVGIAAVCAAAATIAVAVLLRRAERAEIAHVMQIIDACAAMEECPEPARLVS